MAFNFIFSIAFQRISYKKYHLSAASVIAEKMLLFYCFLMFFMRPDNQNCRGWSLNLGTEFPDKEYHCQFMTERVTICHFSICRRFFAKIDVWFSKIGPNIFEQEDITQKHLPTNRPTPVTNCFVPINAYFLLKAIAVSEKTSEHVFSL